MAAASARTRMKWRKLERRKQQKSVARPCSYATATSSSSGAQALDNKSVKEVNEEDNIGSSGCSTPKGKRFRIAEILTCPPAPMKRRVMPICLSNRSPVAFFASPDIEMLPGYCHFHTTHTEVRKATFECGGGKN